MAIFIEVVRTTPGPVPTNVGTATVTVVGPPALANAVISESPPAVPYEDMLWIDIS